MNLLASIAEWARRSPGVIALADYRGETIDYATLAVLSDRIAGTLRRSGVRPGSRVGLVLPCSTDLFLIELAILKAGGCFAPIDPVQPADRIARLLTRAQVSLLVTDDADLTEVAGVAWTDVAHLLAGAPAEPAADTAGDAATPDDPAYCLFTSGSTGVPAGVLISRAAMDIYVAAYARLVESRPGERGAQIGSAGFDVTIDEIWPFLSTGATVTVASEADRSSPHRLAAWLRDARITTTYIPPLLLESLFRMAPTVDLGEVRLVRTGGERLATYPPPDFPCRVLNEYGPTETVAGALFCDVSAWRDRDILPPIGRPLPHIRLSVRGEDGVVVTPGASGELYIGGPTVGIGYLYDEERTARRFVSLDGGRWFRTGDIVRELPTGDLEFLRRIDNQVQVLGKRVELGEVEEAARSYPPVRRVAVVAHEDSHGRAGHLVCYVRWGADGAEADPARLRAHLAAALPDYMVPTEIHEVADFPVTPAGKVDKAALARGYLAAPWDGRAEVAPEELVCVWEEVLELTGLTPDDDFFLHGGTSRRTLDVVVSVRQRLGLSVSARDIFIHPTPRALARFLAENFQ